jgi:phosphoserine phosphatase
MVVFDFDKTLINEDSLFGFYKIVHGDGIIFKLKRGFLILAAIFYKFQFINNDKLKSIGIYLFLKGKSKKELLKASDIYAKSLILNSIYHKIFLKTKKEDRIIVSASPQIYLNRIFPGEKVLGTTFKYKNGVLKNLKFNCYNKNKLEKLFLLYPDISINKVYSDSFSDSPLFENSKKYYIVKDGKII